MSSKRKKRGGRPAKSGAVWRQSADEATLAQNPRYNGFACGHGVHGDRKFNRAKANRAWKAQVRQEGASRGSFLFCVGRLRGDGLARFRTFRMLNQFVCGFWRIFELCELV